MTDKSLSENHRIILGAITVVIIVIILVLASTRSATTPLEETPVAAEAPLDTSIGETVGADALAERARVATMAESWPTTPNYNDGFYALAPALSNTAGENTSTKFDPADDYWGLPRSPGFEEVDIYCTSCHSLEIVMQQKLSRERWEELLVWMQEKQGMAPPEPADLDLLLAYLASEFGTQVAARPGD